MTTRFRRVLKISCQPKFTTYFRIGRKEKQAFFCCYDTPLASSTNKHECLKRELCRNTTKLSVSWRLMLSLSNKLLLRERFVSLLLPWPLCYTGAVFLSSNFSFIIRTFQLSPLGLRENYLKGLRDNSFDATYCTQRKIFLRYIAKLSVPSADVQSCTAARVRGFVFRLIRMRLLN